MSRVRREARVTACVCACFPFACACVLFFTLNVVHVLVHGSQMLSGLCAQLANGGHAVREGQALRVHGRTLGQDGLQLHVAQTNLLHHQRRPKTRPGHKQTNKKQHTQEERQRAQRR